MPIVQTVGETAVCFFILGILRVCFCLDILNVISHFLVKYLCDLVVLHDLWASSVAQMTIVSEMCRNRLMCRSINLASIGNVVL